MGKIKIITTLLLIVFSVFAAAEQNWGIPIKTDLQLKKAGFTLGYSFRYRQAMWVAYTLSAENLRSKQFSRRDRFKADPAVKMHPVRPRDYIRSGYDKGHLAPAADMTYSLPSMENSFLMTNISPQIPGCNRGIWKRVENQVRNWALKEEKIYVITGPIFSEKPSVMGKTEIPVPEAFYKVVLDLTPPMKMIGFIVPNKSSKRRIGSFTASVDEVERLTGYDFFSELEDELENRLEKTNDLKMWDKELVPSRRSKKLLRKTLN